MPPRPLVLLKVLGRSFGAPGGSSFDPHAVDVISSQIWDTARKVRLVVLVGGSNIVQGEELVKKLNLKNKLVAHKAGIVATITNALVLQAAIENRSIKSEIFIDQKFHVPGTGKQYQEREVLSCFEGEVPGIVALLAGGIGESGVTTDFAMVLRGHQLGARCVIRGTIDSDLEVTATTFAEDKKLSVKACDILKQGSLIELLRNERIVA